MKPTKNVYFCQDCGRVKMLFESKLKADTFINFNKDKIREESGFAPKRSYFCLFCAGWHITSKEKEYGKSRLENSFEQLLKHDSIAINTRTKTKKQIIDKKELEISILKELNSLPPDEIISFLNLKIKELGKKIYSSKEEDNYKYSNLLNNDRWIYKKYVGLKKSFTKSIEIALRREHEKSIIDKIKCIPLHAVETYINSKIINLEAQILILKESDDTESISSLKQSNIELNLYMKLRKSYRADSEEALLKRSNEIKIKIESQTKDMMLSNKLIFLDRKIDFIEKN